MSCVFKSHMLKRQGSSTKELSREQRKVCEEKRAVKTGGDRELEA